MARDSFKGFEWKKEKGDRGHATFLLKPKGF
jgi:hypothetical protein